MASGSRPRGRVVALLLVAAACTELDTLDNVDAGGSDAGPSVGEGEGEGDVEGAPRCGLEEPPFYDDTFVPSCEPDADSCDDVNDAPQANIDIVQVWSRRDHSAFVVVIELAAPVPVPDDEFLGFALMFDRDGDRAFGDEEEQGACYFGVGYRTYEGGLAHDHRLLTVIGEEYLSWSTYRDDAGDITSRVELTVAGFDCARDIRMDGRFLELRVPFAEAAGFDDGVAYFLYTHVGWAPEPWHHPTNDDLSFGLCAWVESRGGAPDARHAWEPYPYGACDIVEYGGDPGCENSSEQP